MIISEIIRNKRLGKALSSEELNYFVSSIVDGKASDAQVAAFAMAVCLKGMSDKECAHLTLSMRDSGDVINWKLENLSGPVFDKHSTGGVGDKVSLMLAPILAACGGFVPMISGRGLGHTGGTLDKLEAIPGYNIFFSEDQIKKMVKEVGAVIVGASSEVAPADKRLYSIRDVTATVESLDLITASILSKKMSAGLEYLVMDVKVGSGAFMSELSQAQALSKRILDVAKQSGLKTTALITDMNEPLGQTVGNAIETYEAIEFLTGENIEPRLYEVTIDLCAHLVCLSGLASSYQAAKDLCDSHLRSGKAAEIFFKMLSAQGVDSSFEKNWKEKLPKAHFVKPILAPDTGFISQIDTRALGLCIIEMGGGRRVALDKVDHTVGFSNCKPIGSKISKGDELMLVHAKNEADFLKAKSLVLQAYKIADEKVSNPNKVICEILV